MCQPFQSPDAGLLREGLRAGEQFQVKKLGKCRAKCKEYRQWHEALDEVKHSQPEYKTKFAQMLERLLARRLGVEVRFYTAVYSAFDIFHGVDGFVEVKGVVVTIDVTLNTQKVRAKADLVYHAEDGVVELAARVEQVVKQKTMKLAQAA